MVYTTPEAMKEINTILGCKGCWYLDTKAAKKGLPCCLHLGSPVRVDPETHKCLDRTPR